MNGRTEDLTGVTIIAESGSKYKLTKQAGCGAQGVIYEEGSGSYMVKLYYPSNCRSIDEDVLDKLRFIKDIKMPKNFVSVIDIITSPYIGYVMEKVSDHKPLNSYLIPDKNLSFPEWYNKGLGLYERLYVGYVIAKAFGELERSNLSYCDISGNNILIRTSKDVSVKMIDVDNIYIAGKGKSAVLGTPRYIAPEVVRRQKNPDVLSDNYSLAVILFELLRAGHPYISDDILDATPEDEEAALAGKGEYVTDDNSTNMLPADIVLTEKLKELFRLCFVDGKKNRLSRPSATKFEYALLEASNKLIKCTFCGAWHYPIKENENYRCPWCDAASIPKARLDFYDILFEGTDYKAARVSGKVIQKNQVNSYVIKEKRKNHIKSLYILRNEDFSKDENRASENYVSVAHDPKGFHVYNEFSKSGIVIRTGTSSQFKQLGPNDELLLNDKDEVYFEINNKAVGIECGGTHYSFIRMARFMEVKE